MRKIPNLILNKLDLTLKKKINFKYNVNKKSNVIEIIGPSCIGKSFLLSNLKKATGNKYYYDQEFSSINIHNKEISKYIITSRNILLKREVDITLDQLQETYLLGKNLEIKTKVFFLDFITENLEFEKSFLISEGFVHSFSNSIYEAIKNKEAYINNFFIDKKYIYIQPSLKKIKENLNSRKKDKTALGYTYSNLSGNELDEKINQSIIKYDTIANFISEHNGSVLTVNEETNINQIINFIS